MAGVKGDAAQVPTGLDSEAYVQKIRDALKKRDVEDERFRSVQFFRQADAWLYGYIASRNGARSLVLLHVKVMRALRDWRRVIRTVREQDWGQGDRVRALALVEAAIAFANTQDFAAADECLNEALNLDSRLSARVSKVRMGFENQLRLDVHGRISASIYRAVRAGDVGAAEQLYLSALRVHGVPEQVAVEAISVISMLASGGSGGERHDSLPEGDANEACRLVITCGSGYSGTGAVTAYLREFSELSMPFGTREIAVLKKRYGVCRLLSKWEEWSHEERLHGLQETVLQAILGVPCYEAASSASRLRSRSITLNSLFLGEMLEEPHARAIGVHSRSFIDRARSAMSMEELESACADFLNGVLRIKGGGGALLNNCVHQTKIGVCRLLKNAKIIVITRDPRDQYVAHKTETKGKGVTVESFIRKRRRADAAVRKCLESGSSNVRSFEFESFVTQPRVREEVREWVGLSNVGADSGARFFFPEKSAMNVGIYRKWKGKSEIRMIERELISPPVISRRRRIRLLLERVIPPRLRLLAFWLAAVALPTQVGPRAFLRLADELQRSGRVRAAMLCWRIVHRMAPADIRIFGKRVMLALESGNMPEIDRAVEDSLAGISPQYFVRLAGQLVQHGHLSAAGRVLARLADVPDANRHIIQSPSIVSAGIPSDFRSLGAMVASARVDQSDHMLPLARLCFTFRNPAVAAVLFRRASATDSLEAFDLIAMLHALAETDPIELQDSTFEFQRLLEQAAGNPDALGMLAKAAVITGEMDVAREAVRLALHSLYGNCSQVESDCLAMLEVLATLRPVDEGLPSMLLERNEVDDAGIPKVFLCGFGWSGSGALYDEIRGVPGFSEFEGAGVDAIINQDADSEVMFVQGPGGLGSLWSRALGHGQVSWHALWDTFSLQVVGFTSIGYAQYKSCAAAQRHVRRYGALYTRPFRHFFEGYARLRRDPYPGALHACLVETTESLCSMLVEQAGAHAVLFNNAIFGRNAVMLEIFRSHRAAIVYRDPRDVYVDRCKNDRNHWRTPVQLAVFYANGLHRYMAYKQDHGWTAPDLREVSFERFVEDDGFRARVRVWLLGDVADTGATPYFDPAVSRRNIGIHIGKITSGERAQLQRALADCRTLDRLSEEAWGATDGSHAKHD